MTMTTPPPDIPLLPDENPRAAQVVDLAGMRIRWGRRPDRSPKPCDHRDLSYCQAERRVWCVSCERTLDSFDAFLVLTRYFQAMERASRVKQSNLDEALKGAARKRATKALDHVWSVQGGMAAECPHCKAGLLPEDFQNGVRASWCREIEMARRRRASETPGGDR